MEIKVCLIPGSAQFLDTLIHTQWVYDALILHGHMTPVSIDADPGDPMLNIGANSSLSASKGTVDITQDFLKKNQKLIAAFASQHLTPEANVLAFGCKSANNIVELDGEIYNVTSIAESLSHAFKWHNVIGSRHQIAIASDLREKNQPIYGKNFLCAALGTVFLDIKNLNLYFKEGEGERIEPLVYITMIRSKVAGWAWKYKEIELPSTQGVRPITAEDLPRFYYQN